MRSYGSARRESIGKRREFIGYLGGGALTAFGLAALPGTARGQARSWTESWPKADWSKLGQFPTLSLKERDRRWGLIRRMMESNGVEALIVPSNHGDDSPNNYLTNAWVTNVYGAAAFFPLKGEPVVFIPDPSTAGGVAQLIANEKSGVVSWVQDWRFAQGGDEQIVDLIRYRGLEKSRLGTIGISRRDGIVDYWVRGEHPWNVARLRKVMQAALPKAGLVELWTQFEDIWFSKSEEEVAMYRKAAAINDLMAEVYFDMARAGVTQGEVLARMRYEINRSGVEGTVTGGYDGWARVLKAGDVFNTELFAYCGNIQGQVQASACIGEPSRLIERLAETARESYEAGLKVLRPGATWGELGLAMEAPTLRQGFWHPTPMCHMLNPENDFSYINIGIEGPSGLPGFKDRFFRERDMPAHQDSTGFKRADRVLQAGNTIELEPNATVHRERVNIGGNVLVTKDGCEELNPSTSFMRVIRA